MYSIEVRNKSGTYAVYNPYDEDITVMEASLDLEINKSGTLTFSLAQSHPNIGQIIPLASEIYVWDDSKLVWIGRPIEIQTDFSETRTVTCEGVLGYLLDSQMPAFDYTEGNSKTVRAFLVAVLNNHNTAVKKTGYANAGLNKTFNIGTVTVTDSNNNIARSAEDYNSSMEIINTRLISPLGGILRARWSADGSTRYIDYLDGVGDAGQDVIFGENLLDLSKHLKSDTIITALYPKGASNEDGTNLTLAGYAPASSVVVSGISKNKADAYIWSPSAVNQYGYIYGTAEWEDVTLVQNLYTKSAEYLKAASVMGTTIELSAVDLSRISVEYSRFEVGQMVNVVSIPHDVNAPYQLTRMKINLLNPADSDLVLGGELKTFTFENTKSQMERDLKVASEINDAVQTATSLISGGLGGHVILKPNSEGRPEEMLIMDTADIATVKKLWRWNLGGLGYSSNGYGGPYGTAITMDGAIVADYIKTGTLNANLIKAGTLNANLIKAGVLSDVNNNTRFNLSTGELNINKGSINLGNGAFSVTNDGRITAKNGSIGPLSITKALVYTKSSDGKGFCGFNAFSNYAAGGLVFGELTGSTQRITGHINAKSTQIVGLFCDSEDELLKLEDGECGIHILKNRLRFMLPDRTYSSAPNIRVDSDGFVRTTTWTPSSRQLKEKITKRYSNELAPENLYKLDVVQFRYNDAFKRMFNPAEDDPRQYDSDRLGIIIEDLDKVYPIAIDKEDVLDPKTWTRNDVYLIPPMLKLIQDQHVEIEAIKAELKKGRDA